MSRDRAALYCKPRCQGAPTRNPAIKDEERELFRAAMRGVKPLGKAKVKPLQPRARRPARGGELHGEVAHREHRRRHVSTRSRAFTSRSIPIEAASSATKISASAKTSVQGPLAPRFLLNCSGAP